MNNNDIVSDLHVHLFDNPSEKDFFEHCRLAPLAGFIDRKF